MAKLGCVQKWKKSKNCKSPKLCSVSKGRKIRESSESSSPPCFVSDAAHAFLLPMRLLSFRSTFHVAFRFQFSVQNICTFFSSFCQWLSFMPVTCFCNGFMWWLSWVLLLPRCLHLPPVMTCPDLCCLQPSSCLADFLELFSRVVSGCPFDYSACFDLNSWSVWVIDYSCFLRLLSEIDLFDYSAFISTSASFGVCSWNDSVSG